MEHSEVISPAASHEAHALGVKRAEEFVRQRIAGHDSSHDWWHIERVRRLALRLAAAEGLAVSPRACCLHHGCGRIQVGTLHIPPFQTGWRSGCPEAGMPRLLRLFASPPCPPCQGVAFLPLPACRRSPSHCPTLLQDAEVQLAELAALLHDVADHKYR